MPTVNGRLVPYRMKSCYALDLDGNRLMVVRGERNRGGMVFTPVSADDASLKEAIRQNEPFIACLSTKESFTHWVEAPFASARKAAKVLHTLLDVDLPFPLEDCVYFFVGAHRTSKRTTRALAIAARRRDVEAKIKALNALGIDPQVLDQEGLALWTQSLRDTPILPGETDLLRVVMHLGTDRVTLVVGRGETFLSAHGMLSRDPVQISRLLRTHQAPGEGALRWIWTGSGVESPESFTQFRSELEKEWPGPSSVANDPSTFLPRALATRCLAGDKLQCNFRTGSLTHTAIVRQQKARFRRMAVTSLAAGLLLCAINLTLMIDIRYEETVASKTFSALATDLAGHDIGSAKGEHALKIVRDKVDKRIEATRPFLEAFKPSLAGTISHTVEIANKHDLRYELLTVTRDKITVAGTAGDWNGPEQLYTYLVQAGYKLKLDRKDAMTGDRVPFSIAPGGAND